MTARRWGGLALRLLVSVALITWVLRQIEDPGRVLSAIRSASPAWLVAAFSLHLVGLWISALRWGWLLRAHGGRVRTRQLAGSYLVAYFFNTFLPSGFGGDVVRAYDTRTATAGGERAAAVVVMDRASGILALFSLGTVVYLAGGWAPRLPWQVGALIVGGLVGGTAALALAVGLGERLPAEPAEPTGSASAPGLLRKLGARLAKFADGMREYRDHPRLMAEVFGLGVALQLNVVLHHAFLGLALGFEVELGYYFLVVPIIVAVMAVPVAINAIGPREAAVVMLFGLVGVPQAKALALSLVALAMVLVFSAAGGLLFALRRVRGAPGTA